MNPSETILLKSVSSLCEEEVALSDIRVVIHQYHTSQYRPLKRRFVDDDASVLTLNLPLR